MQDKKQKAMEALLAAVKDQAEKATKALYATESMHHTQAALNAANAYMGLQAK